MLVADEEQAFIIEVDGKPIPARSGQTVAAALLAAGCRVWRRSPAGAPRGLFCGMGACFECLVTIEGLSNQRACLTAAQPGMHVRLAREGTRHDGD